MNTHETGAKQNSSISSNQPCDFAIIGGGIVGLATALALTESLPNARVVLLEKEAQWAAHQTGRNSGVIHSGIYYKPGSLKARFAREGNIAMTAFCREYSIPYDICGKLIVATQESELSQLEKLYLRGVENGLRVEKIALEQLREIEPHAAGIAAIRVLDAGITDYKAVTEKMSLLLEERGVDLRLGTKVVKLDIHSSGTVLETDRGELHAKFLINCAGLQCDRIAKLAGAPTQSKIIPFRGEYYTLRTDARHLVKNLIYPVPDPSFPFLGVHFTRMISGEIHAGPNAVLSLKREGYHRTDFDLHDCMDTLGYPGFWKLAARHWRAGYEEVVRSFSKAAFVSSLQKLIPEITADDIIPSPSGVRAQALLNDGSLVDDFDIQLGPNSLHVCNAPSPAATASLEIGRYVADKVINSRS